MALLVSGGHTELVYVAAPGDYKIIGETRDDAVGEAYDKVGRVMNLTYPAGREIDGLAHQGEDVFNFPRAMMKHDDPALEFSFSGLKSAFINDRYYEDVAKGLLNLVCAFDPEVILLGGGISANDEFLGHLSERIDKIKQHHKSLNHLTGMTVADIKPCLLRNDAGLIGAVYQAKQIIA